MSAVDTIERIEVLSPKNKDFTFGDAYSVAEEIQEQCEDYNIVYATNKNLIIINHSNFLLQ